MNSTLLENLRQKHGQRYGGTPTGVAFAPGRVEILGNHTDYNEGFVLSAAIDLGTFVTVSPLADARCDLYAADVDQHLSVPLPVEKPVDAPHWANYLLGVVHHLGQAIRLPTGLQIAFAGDIPLGAGLSSSASLEVATALALCQVSRIGLPRLELARIAQKAEHTFTGVKCGLLDQISALFGESRALVFTDFRSLEATSVPLNGEICFLMANTAVKHRLVEGEYNERRQRCEEAAAFFAGVLDHPVKALRDVSEEEWTRFAPRLDPITARRAAHVIGENRRVLEARRLLQAGDLIAVGQLMYQSHQSSQTNFENSCRELDAIVEQAGAMRQVLGARLSGGGFGGSVVLMVRPGDAAGVRQVILKHYEEQFGNPCDVRAITPSAGARVL